MWTLWTAKCCSPYRPTDACPTSRWRAPWTSPRRRCWAASAASRRAGAIRGYRAVIDPAALGITVRALVVARLREHSERSIQAFEEGIRSVPGVRACYHVTGQFDMVVELALRDLDHLGQLIRVDIARIPGVMNLETMLIMAEPVADEGWPVVPEA